MHQVDRLKQVTSTHKAVLDFHTSLICLRGCHHVKVPSQCCYSCLQHHLRKVLSTANPGACPKRHHVLCHRCQFFRSRERRQPPFRHEDIWRREDPSITMHGPCLGRNDGAWRKAVAQQVEVLVSDTILARRRNHALEKAWRCTVQTKTYTRLTCGTGSPLDCSPSLMKALRYGNSCITEISGRCRESGMASSNSAWSFLAISARRLSSQNRYASVVDVVSAPAILMMAPFMINMSSEAGLTNVPYTLI